MTIKSDNHTECREFFEVAIKDVLVRSGNIQQSLTEQERNRIIISPDRAQVIITDDNKPRMYVNAFESSL